MASHIEMEIHSCLTEIKKLQAKMKKLQTKIVELQEQKKLDELIQEEKANNVELNLAVMKKWFKSIEKTKDEYIIEEKVIRLNKESEFQYRRSCGNLNEQERELFQKWATIQQTRLRGKAESQKVELFHIQDNNNKKNRPSQFMLQYIESTYNLFQIQQKQIDELQITVSEILANMG